MLTTEDPPARPDMHILLDEEACSDHRIAASKALQHHWLGETQQALAWESLASFLRVSEAYIFDDISAKTA